MLACRRFLGPEFDAAFVREKNTKYTRAFLDEVSQIGCTGRMGRGQEVKNLSK